jgi:hypothetical protein
MKKSFKLIIVLALLTLTVNWLTRDVVFYRASILHDRGVSNNRRTVYEIFVGNRDTIYKLYACDNNITGSLLRFVFVLKKEVSESEEWKILNDIPKILKQFNGGRRQYEVFFCLGKKPGNTYVMQTSSDASSMWHLIPNINEILTWKMLKIMLRTPSALMYPGTSSVPLEERTPHLPDADGTYRA